jgi:hypothetical protein
LFLWLV